ncbi:DeoR family transcriptional regulator [Bradyrhizobium brasilense]|uniref:DeoR family transcriptional regulator n=1 Tax=Bradyrhizobium brasilense TaxID=1419277 RepID=UPI003D311454
MWQEERRRYIRSMLATFGTLRVDRLTEDFGVSLEPIRRDLMETKKAENSAGSAAEALATACSSRHCAAIQLLRSEWCACP